MYKTIQIVVLAMVISTVAALAPAQEQRVPGDVLTAYIDAVRATPQFRMANQLRLAPTQAAVEKWQKGVSAGVQLTATSFVSGLLSQQVMLADGSWAILERRPDSQLLSHGQFLSVSKDGKNQAYRVNPTDLAEFRFRYVKTIVVIDPANVARETLSFQEMDLSKVAEMLSTMGNIDLAMGVKTRDRPQVNLTLRHKSPADALKFAAKAAGWNMEFAVNGKKSEAVPDKHLQAHDLMAQYETAQQTGPIEDDQGNAASSLLEYVRMKFAEATEQMQRQRPVAIFKLPASSIPEVRIR